LEAGLSSYRVAEGSVSLTRFDVVGQDGDEPAFIGHAGLANSAGSQNAAEIPVLDMGPPLHGQNGPGRLRADVVGSAALNDDEVQKITIFVNRHASEHMAFLQFRRRELMNVVPQVYIVRPHAKPFYEEDGRYARMRFSCSGFVLEAYRKARIRLLDSKMLPLADMGDIRLCYPSEIFLMEHGRVSPEDLGLEGAGPWRVLFCGYLFHALNRDAAAVRSDPYVPSIADRYFA
jgi:hypothetical protein